jgi:hypothetical protein
MMTLILFKLLVVCLTVPPDATPVGIGLALNSRRFCSSSSSLRLLSSLSARAALRFASRASEGRAKVGLVGGLDDLFGAGGGGN